MIIKARADIFKSIYNTEKALSLETPSSVAEVLNDTGWKITMQEEFNALTRN